MQIRNFKKTELNKNVEGIDAGIDKIRSNLNKLTNNNFNLILKDILCVLENLLKNYEDKKEEIILKYLI